MRETSCPEIVQYGKLTVREMSVYPPRLVYAYTESNPASEMTYTVSIGALNSTPSIRKQSSGDQDYVVGNTEYTNILSAK